MKCRVVFALGLIQFGLTVPLQAEPPPEPFSPSGLRDYVAEWAAEVEQIPESERAWPLYEQAARLLKRWEEYLPEEGAGFSDAWPDRPEWPHFVHWLNDSQEALNLAKEGAKQRIIGVPITTDSGDGSSLPEYLETQKPRMMVAVNLPHLGTARTLARLLCVEMVDAAEKGDSRRWVEAFEAGIAIPPQLLAERPILSQLVGFAVLALIIERIVWTLDKHPALINGEQLEHIAGLLDQLARSDRVRITHDHVQTFLQDLLQRLFEPGPEGRVTDDGIRLLTEMAGGVDAMSRSLRGDEPSDPDVWSGEFIRSQLRERMGTRRENEAMADRVYLAAKRDWSHPLWQMDLRESKTLSSEIVGLRWKYAPVGLFLPSNRSYLAQEQANVLLDGCRLSVGLSRYRIANGRYPQSLDELVPDFLSQMPIDRYSGRPFGYRLNDGKPLLYGAGVDQDDDGGVPMTPRHSPFPVETWQDLPPVERPSGDWVIWPPHRS